MSIDADLVEKAVTTPQEEPGGLYVRDGDLNIYTLQPSGLKETGQLNNDSFCEASLQEEFSLGEFTSAGGYTRLAIWAVIRERYGFALTSDVCAS